MMLLFKYNITVFLFKQQCLLHKIYKNCHISRRVERKLSCFELLESLNVNDKAL